MTTPTKHDAAIARKLAKARADADVYRRKAAFIGNQGGPHPVFQRVEFHEARVRLWEWITAASTEVIDQRRRQLESEMGEAVAFKYGSMLHLPDKTVMQLAMLDIYEYALGLHQHQQPEKASA